MADTIATAYVQIEPTFDGVAGKLKAGLGDESESAGKSAGGSFGKGFASVMGTTGKVMAGAVAAGGAAIGAMGAKFISASGDVAAYGDNIDKMSQKMGLTAEAYQEWDAVMQHSGTSMETMKASMKTLANAAQTGNDAFEQLGISQEQLASMSQQDIFEATIAGLQNVEDTTQRTYLAGKLLGRGATELGPLLNSSAEETQAMRDRVKELGGVMSNDAVKAAAAYQDQLQDMQTAFSGLSRNMMSEFLPDVTTVMAGLTEIFSGNTEGGLGMITEGINGIANNLTQALPQLLQVASGIVTALGQAIVQNLPMLLSTGISILQQLATGILQAIPTMLPTIIDFVVQLGNMIIESLPLLVEAAAQIIVNLALGIAQALPELIPTIVNVVMSIALYLIENIDLLIDAAVQLMIGLATGLINALPVLIEKGPQIIMALLNALLSAIPKLLQAALQIITTMVKGIMTYGPQLLTAGVNLIINLRAKLIEKAKAFIDIGKNIVEGIKKGISNAWESFTKWVLSLLGGMVDDIVKFFKIGSPSKLMADKVGQWIPAGVAEGIQNGMGVLDDTIANMNTEMLETAINPTVMSTYMPSTTEQSDPLTELMGLLRTYLPQIADSDTNVVLEGDADRLFRAVQSKSRQYKQTTGQSAFA